MFVSSGLYLLAIVQLFPLIYGFTCYKCSYDRAQTGSGGGRECIEHPERLGRGDRLQCNSTSFCVLQEVFDLTKKEVKSYFRSCSGNTWGNECNHYWTEVTCRASCQGNYCNEHDNGTRHVEYIKEHKGVFGHVTRVTCSWITVVFWATTTLVIVTLNMVLT